MSSQKNMACCTPSARDRGGAGTEGTNTSGPMIWQWWKELPANSVIDSLR